jgi:hypothetical protein
MVGANGSSSEKMLFEVVDGTGWLDFLNNALLGLDELDDP